MRTGRRLAPWVALAIVLVVALALGTRSSSHPTLDQRVRHVAAQIRCPVCEGQSAADSDSAASRAIRDDIRARLLSGESDHQVLDYLARVYPGSKLLPEARGVGLVVWLLPVLAVGAAIAGLAVAFLRWRARPRSTATPEDVALVERALGP